MTTGLAVMTAPAQAFAQPRWYRGSASEATIYLEKTRVGSTNWWYVKQAGAEWAKSSRIKIVFVTRCPSKLYCVKVYDGRWSKPMAGWTLLNADPRTNYAWYGSVHLNTRYLTSSAARRKTACHELGHAVGLDHRGSGRTCMRDGFGTMYGHPDSTDYVNLRKIYARP
jgi:hypothetical protein